MANYRQPPSSGGSATIVSKTITTNGTYNASSDNADGYDPVTVNVPSKTIVSKTITANGTYNASSDNADGYDPVTVNVPSKTIVSKTITANGTYNASSDNADGYNPVTVNVPLPSGRLIDHSSRRYSGWYISSQDYKYKEDASDPTAVTISWPVESGHDYILMVGTNSASVPNRHRLGYANSDLVANPVETILTGYFEDDLSAVKSYYGSFIAPLTGYLIDYCGLPNPDNNMILYLMDVTGKNITGILS